MEERECFTVAYYRYNAGYVFHNKRTDERMEYLSGVLKGEYAYVGADSTSSEDSERNAVQL